MSGRRSWLRALEWALVIALLCPGARGGELDCSRASAEDPEAARAAPRRSPAVADRSPPAALATGSGTLHLRVGRDGNGTLRVLRTNGPGVGANSAGEPELLFEGALPSPAARLAGRGPAAISAPSLLRRAPAGADLIYFGDSAGTVWRLVLAASEPGAQGWKLSPVAYLGSGARFAYPSAPVLSVATDAGGQAFHGVLLTAARSWSSGETDHSLYYLRDYAAPAAVETAPVRPEQLADIAHCADAGASCLHESDAGWRIETALVGRRVVGGPLLEGGRVFMTVYRSSPERCVGVPVPTELLALDLASGAPLHAGRYLHPLGSRQPEAVALREDGVWWPGIEGAAAALRGLAAARGAGVFSLHWRDLRVGLD